MLILQSIVVYTLLTLFMFAFAKRATVAEQHKVLLNAIPIILFTLVFGLRYSVGVDWENYREIYEEEMTGMSSLGEMIQNSRLEIGFILIVYICKVLSFPTYMMFVICSFIQILLLYCAFKDEDNILPYVYLTFMLSGIAIYGFTNVIRQDIAFCFFLCAIKFAKNQRIVPYLLLCSCALCFHKSALIIFPCYLLWIKREDFFHRPLIQIIAVFSCFLFQFLNPIGYILGEFSDFITILGYEDYIESAEDMATNNQLGITRLTKLFADLIIVFSSNDIKKYYNSPLLNRMYDLFLIGVCCSYLFLGNMMFLRISLYFTNFQFIVYAYALLYFFSKEIRQLAFRKIMSFIVCLSLISSYASTIYNSENSTSAYVSYFQTDLHYIKDMQRESMLFKQR